MKRLRKSEANTEAAAEEATPPPAPSERRSGLLRECWADLRGRPRPTSAPAREDEMRELQSVPDTGGVGLDEDGMRRLHSRYQAPTN